ncbi:MAG: right-handed parallel beta-helix repeat-containing protein [Saprospiraceae bacterium]|nr:right-handed parallel beta-helix repeat-containing protein [Saprospiraceae bacterium]
MKQYRIHCLMATIFLLSFFSTSAQFGNLQTNLKKGQDKVQNSLNKGNNAPRASNSTPTNPTTPAAAEGKDYYVCAATGKGKLGTKDQPAKDIAALAMQLQAGDRVHIAEGVYSSKMEQSTDVFETPISIIGGYSADFSKRDPWGAHQTIFSGTNDITKSLTTERIGILTEKAFKDWAGEILIDGIIVDNGARNFYRDPAETLISRKASPEIGKNATPDAPGIKVRTGAGTRVVIQNCIVTNVAATQGAIDVQVGKNGTALIKNCLVVNNTGEGINCKSAHHGADGLPTYTIQNCTVLFCWKHDAIATFGGNCLKFDTDLTITAENNTFGFGDYGGVDNIKQCKKVTLRNNLFVGHKKYDYREYNTNMSIGDLEDYANFISPQSGGNYSETINLALDRTWAERYFNRKEISRAEVDASAKVSNSGANQLRAMFGLPLQAGSVGKDAEIWLHRIALENVLKIGQKSFAKGAGCNKPL